MTLNVAAVVVYYYLLGLGYLGVALWVVHEIRSSRRDEHRGADEAYADELHEVRVLLSGEVPIVAGVWRPAQDGDTPGAVVPDDAPAVGPDLITRAVRAGEFAAALTQALTTVEARLGPGRHRAHGLRDDRRRVLHAPTGAFLQIAAGEGYEVAEIGPREADLAQCRRIEWTAQEWAQAALPIADNHVPEVLHLFAEALAAAILREDR